MSLFAISYMAMWILVLLLFAAVVLLYRELGRKLATRRGRLDEMGPELGKEVAVSVAEVGALVKKVVFESEFMRRLRSGIRTWR
jgi:hypothetical protein